MNALMVGFNTHFAEISYDQHKRLVVPKSPHTRVDMPRMHDVVMRQTGSEALDSRGNPLMSQLLAQQANGVSKSNEAYVPQTVCSRRMCCQIPI